MEPVKTLERYQNVQSINFKGRDLLRIDEFSSEELRFLLDFAIKLKQMQKARQHFQPLAGKTLGLIFSKASTRTRVSFEVGMYQLGGMSMFLSDKDLQIGRGEPISDTAKVLSRYVDGIMIRTHAHTDVEVLAWHAAVPIINGLTDQYHPCQALADMLTILEHKNRLHGVKLAYVGDGNNVANSLILAATLLGLEVRVATPEGFGINADIVNTAANYAANSGGKLLITHDPKEAVNGADVIYNDVWTSMGFESENEIRLQAFAKYQVNQQLVDLAKSDYLFMHCLPAHRGEEVAAEVIDGPHSVVFDQAENRLHAQKAILASFL